MLRPWSRGEVPAAHYYRILCMNGNDCGRGEMVFFLSEQFEVGRSISLDVLLEPKTTWFGCAMHLAARVSPNLGSAWCTYAATLQCIAVFCLMPVLLCSAVLCSGIFCFAAFSWCLLWLALPRTLFSTFRSAEISSCAKPKLHPTFSCLSATIEDCLVWPRPSRQCANSKYIAVYHDCVNLDTVVWDDYLREATYNIVMI